MKTSEKNITFIFFGHVQAVGTVSEFPTITFGNIANVNQWEVVIFDTLEELGDFLLKVNPDLHLTLRDNPHRLLWVSHLPKVHIYQGDTMVTIKKHSK